MSVVTIFDVSKEIIRSLPLETDEYAQLRATCRYMRSVIPDNGRFYREALAKGPNFIYSGMYYVLEVACNLKDTKIIMKCAAFHGVHNLCSVENEISIFAGFVCPPFSVIQQMYDIFPWYHRLSNHVFLDYALEKSIFQWSDDSPQIVDWCLAKMGDCDFEDFFNYAIDQNNMEAVKCCVEKSSVKFDLARALTDGQKTIQNDHKLISYFASRQPKEIRMWCKEHLANNYSTLGLKFCINLKCTFDLDDPIDDSIISNAIENGDSDLVDYILGGSKRMKRYEN